MNILEHLISIKRQLYDKQPIYAYQMKVERITYEAPGVKTFMLRFVNEEDQNKFDFRAGQFGEYSVYGVGESHSALHHTNPKRYIECTFRQTGKVTNALSDCEEGSIIGFRGPYGNTFPLDEWKGKSLLFIAGE